MRVIKTNKQVYKNSTLYEVYKKDELVGNFILDTQRDEFYLYLEHIYRVQKFKGIRLLEFVIKWIEENIKPEKLTALPIDNYRPYYESLGFKVYKTLLDDVYYVKEMKGKE